MVRMQRIGAGLGAAALALGVLLTSTPASAEMVEGPECQNDPQGGCQQGPLGGMGAGGSLGPLPGGVPWDPGYIMSQWDLVGVGLEGAGRAIYQRVDGGSPTIAQADQVRWAGGYGSCAVSGATQVTCL